MQTVKRCAIYTRKSHEEGLDMEFNSLDAQREAGEAYVASQKANGWMCLPEHYDDGGFSGGNLNRPALKKLLSDCEAGKIDIVVVYKIDRLSRSLCDFAELTKQFEQWNVAFVSVTQEINTNTSAGRMMLNILMTFAQFEREIIAERIRDKMSSARKKGKYIGGVLPLGYRADTQAMKIVVEPEEAKIVRFIFETFVESCSIKEVQRELASQGVVVPVRTSKKGVSHGGHAISRTVIRNVLRNPIYIGKIRYHGKVYDGEHEAMIPEELFNKAQECLGQKIVRKPSAVIENPFAGIIYCGYCNKPMFRTKHSNGNGRQYQYYVCTGDDKRAFSTCPVHRVPADDIDNIMLKQIENVLKTPTMLAKICGHDLSPDEVYQELSETSGTYSERKAQLSVMWDSMFPAERRKLACALLKKVLVYEHEIRLVFHGGEVGKLMNEAGLPYDMEHGDENCVLSVACRRKKHNNRTIVVLENGGADAGCRSQMQHALLQAEKAMAELISGRKPTIEAVAAELGVDRSFAARTIQLANLAPDIVKLIWEGRQPASLTLNKLREGIPESWEEQRRVFGVV